MDNTSRHALHTSDTDTSNVSDSLKAPDASGMHHVSSPSDTASERAQIRQQLREEAKQARANMPAPYRAHKSAEICKRLEESLMLTLGITDTNPSQATIAVYAAFHEEVDLNDFITYVYSLGCRVVFPCMVSDAHDSSHLTHSENSQGTQCIEGLQNIDTSNVCTPALPAQTMEMRRVSHEAYTQRSVAFLNNPLKRYTHDHPDLEQYPYVPACELTMIVVPVVGFDKHGNRLGYGSGNYDRYLTQIPQTCRIAGVAFDEQYVEDIPVEDHDIAIPIIAL